MKEKDTVHISTDYGLHIKEAVITYINKEDETVGVQVKRDGFPLQVNGIEQKYITVTQEFDHEAERKAQAAIAKEIEKRNAEAAAKTIAAHTQRLIPAIKVKPKNKPKTKTKK